MQSLDNFRLALRIHLNDNSDNESDSDEDKQLDENYFKLQPDPYKLEDIQDKIIVISNNDPRPCEKYTTRSWKDLIPPYEYFSLSKKQFLKDLIPLYGYLRLSQKQFQKLNNKTIFQEISSFLHCNKLALNLNTYHKNDSFVVDFTSEETNFICGKYLSLMGNNLSQRSLFMEVELFAKNLYQSRSKWQDYNKTVFKIAMQKLMKENNVSWRIEDYVEELSKLFGQDLKFLIAIKYFNFIYHYYIKRNRKYNIKKFSEVQNGNMILLAKTFLLNKLEKVDEVDTDFAQNLLIKLKSEPLDGRNINDTYCKFQSFINSFCFEQGISIQFDSQNKIPYLLEIIHYCHSWNIKHMTDNEAKRIVGKLNKAQQSREEFLIKNYSLSSLDKGFQNEGDLFKGLHSQLKGKELVQNVEENYRNFIKAINKFTLNNVGYKIFRHNPYFPYLKEFLESCKQRRKKYLTDNQVRKIVYEVEKTLEETKRKKEILPAESVIQNGEALTKTNSYKSENGDLLESLFSQLKAEALDKNRVDENYKNLLGKINKFILENNGCKVLDSEKRLSCFIEFLENCRRFDRKYFTKKQVRKIVDEIEKILEENKWKKEISPGKSVIQNGEALTENNSYKSENCDLFERLFSQLKAEALDKNSIDENYKKLLGKINKFILENIGYTILNSEERFLCFIEFFENCRTFNRKYLTNKQARKIVDEVEKILEENKMKNEMSSAEYVFQNKKASIDTNIEKTSSKINEKNNTFTNQNNVKQKLLKGTGSKIGENKIFKTEDINLKKDKINITGHESMGHCSKELEKCSKPVASILNNPSLKISYKIFSEYLVTKMLISPQSFLSVENILSCQNLIEGLEHKDIHNAMSNFSSQILYSSCQYFRIFKVVLPGLVIFEIGKVFTTMIITNFYKNGKVYLDSTQVNFLTGKLIESVEIGLKLIYSQKQIEMLVNLRESVKKIDINSINATVEEKMKSRNFGEFVTYTTLASK